MPSSRSKESPQIIFFNGFWAINMFLSNFNFSWWILFIHGPNKIFCHFSPLAHSEMSNICFPPPFQNQQNISEWANFGPFLKFLERNSVKKRVIFKFVRSKIVSFLFLYPFWSHMSKNKAHKFENISFFTEFSSKNFKKWPKLRKWEFLAHIFITNYNPNGGKMSHIFRYMV